MASHRTNKYISYPMLGHTRYTQRYAIPNPIIISLILSTDNNQYLTSSRLHAHTHTHARSDSYSRIFNVCSTFLWTCKFYVMCIQEAATVGRILTILSSFSHDSYVFKVLLLKTTYCGILDVNVCV